MANNLFKKSYQHKILKEITFNSLWNTKGVFTTIRVTGSPPKFLFLKEHLLNLNKSLKKLNINFNLTKKKFNILISNQFLNNIQYNHLLRIAVNNKIISIDLRKRSNPNKFFKGLLVNYQRSKPEIKNLNYKKIFQFLKPLKINSEEIILYKKNYFLEGATTNIIFIKNNKLYIPKKNYYFGITLQFIKKNTKRQIIKTNISLKKINDFDEILLVGSGKGIVALSNIPQLRWKKKKQVIYKELQELYNLHIER